MATSLPGWRRLRAIASGATDLASDLGQATGYAVRTFTSPAGLRGLAVEWAWLSAHLALYPIGLAEETVRAHGHWRTDTLPPVKRSLVVADPAAAGTPILLIHGIMDNRSVFTVFAHALRRRGFGTVHAINYSLLTGDLRSAAHELRGHVERLREATGSDKVHIVGHSLGGVVARYYVQRMGGDDVVDTLVTLDSPHSGSNLARLAPTALCRQLRPGSEVLAELDAPAPGCRTRFLVVWSRMDEVVVPQRNARLQHPDLDVQELHLDDVGHLSLPIDRRTVHWVASTLARGEVERREHDAVRDRRLRGSLRPAGRHAVDAELDGTGGGVPGVPPPPRVLSRGVRPPVRRRTTG
ncbi:putative secreted lipase [Pseudonocardia sp. Ae356_Ps1]|uniref:esterase/lipase family protein n=1 Tax=Pseudonocardia sp. Ae356_Ps1 TaxID=1885032 RepID=UPI00096827A3|nr:alpha/beta fold hydrolase [Pseudonocardia sp. Ae356_Ps1]OLL94131.1 putative secreted lipase [Pseudonocardia sp. Ae356_Ps1]